MAFNNKKILSLLAAVAMSVPAVALATPTTITATVNFLAALTFSVTPMSFGNVAATGDPSVAGTPANNWIRLGTNGASDSGSGVLTSGLTATRVPGLVDITAGATIAVEVRCSTGATMTDNQAGGGVLPITNVEVVAVGSEAAPGAGNACAGITGAAATTLTLNGTPTTHDAFKFGARIDGGGLTGTWDLAHGAYSTASTGGTPIQVDISYQ